MPQFNNVMQPSPIKRPKIAPLSVLPVFLNMKNANVLVAGNSDAVAWKTELLLASGAYVTLYATSPSDALEHVILSHKGELTHNLKPWAKEDFTDVKLALGDFNSKNDAKKFAAAAREQGVAVNVIDKPEFCDFQFGAIVNRSPVVVSISTTGAAPILAQQLRTRIEMLLPPTISDWALRAKQLREILMKRVPDAAVRKSIWNEFARNAMFEPKSKISNFFEKAVNQSSKVQKGKVTLVGAGPGDAGLLTIKAVRALQSADVILFDKLVSTEVLELARREAKRMLVGKRGGKISCKQDDINALMLKLGKQGKNVVRLKSGDPMIFGRAGEEIAILEAEGIDVEVIPGVTAALAAASQLGVSLTHRDHAQSVKFITAHSREGKLPELDWKSCADEKTTLMVYMGAKTAPSLAEALMDFGMAKDMPVLIAKGVSGSNSEVSYHRLVDLLALSITRDQPVLLGIGRVFSERKNQSELNEIQNSQPGELAVLAG